MMASLLQMNDYMVIVGDFGNTNNRDLLSSLTATVTIKQATSSTRKTAVVTIIGGGVAGLSAAYELQQQGIYRPGAYSVGLGGINDVVVGGAGGANTGIDEECDNLNDESHDPTSTTTNTTATNTGGTNSASLSSSATSSAAPTLSTTDLPPLECTERSATSTLSTPSSPPMEWFEKPYKNPKELSNSNKNKYFKTLLNDIGILNRDARSTAKQPASFAGFVFFFLWVESDDSGF